MKKQKEYTPINKTKKEEMDIMKNINGNYINKKTEEELGLEAILVRKQITDISLEMLKLLKKEHKLTNKSYSMNTVDWEGERELLELRKAISNKRKEILELTEKEYDILDEIEADDLNEENYFISWVDKLVLPLANEISRLLDMDYEINGPSGIKSRTTITFKKDTMKLAKEQPSLSITVMPNENETESLSYETGEVNKSIEKGTLAYENGMHLLEKELPANVEDVLGLLKGNIFYICRS